MQTFKNIYLLTLSWITAFNPDLMVKCFSVAASIAVIISSISTYKKNQRK